MPEKTNRFITLKQVRLRDTFFSPVQQVVMETMIPYQEKVLHDEIPNIKQSHVIHNFQIAAGEIQGKYEGRVFQDSDLAKWLEAVAYSLTLKPDPELEKRADAAEQKSSRMDIWIHILLWRSRSTGGRI